jgi:aconitate hydratase
LKSSYKPNRGWRRFRDAFRVWHQRSVGTCSGNQFQRFAPAGGRRDGKIIMASLDSFKCLRPLKVGSKTYAYYSLPVAEKNGLKGISRLPFSLKVLLENMLRHEDGRTVTKEDILAVAQWLKTKTSDREIAFRPARVLMQDFTGVPAVVDLAAMRDAMKRLGGDPK